MAAGHEKIALGIVRKSLRHVAMVAKFLYPATNRAPANMTEKKGRKN